MSEIRSSNPVIGKIYIEHLFTVNCIEKTKIKKKEAGNGPIFKWGCLNLCVRESNKEMISASLLSLLLTVFFLRHHLRSSQMRFIRNKFKDFWINFGARGH